MDNILVTGSCQYVNKTLVKLRNIAKKGISHADMELSLEAIAACGYIEYKFNQEYIDDELEHLLSDLASHKDEIPYSPNHKTVLFYDETGFDIRGLAIIYLKGLAESGYKVIYVTRDSAIDKQPIHHKTLDGYDIINRYFDFDARYLTQINSLSEIIREFKPEFGIAHSGANNPVWPIVFSRFAKSMKRYVINLTDHGFWLGKDSVDYVLEFRNYGASVSYYYRGIEKKKQIMLPYYPFIFDGSEFKGLPFDEDKRFIFSGGSLYKTIGKDNIYYNTVRKLLRKFTDLLFFYVGNGDTTYIKQLMLEFPNRVYYEEERSDFTHIMERCTMYLSTYPVIGGLMTQYAAACGKVPLTINHGGRAEGLLLDDHGFPFCQNAEELYEKAEMLLENEALLAHQNSKMLDLVVTPTKFAGQLDMALTCQRTDFPVCYKEIDSKEIHEEHRFSFDRASVRRGIAKKTHSRLLKYFPLLFAERYILSIQGKY